MCSGNLQGQDLGKPDALLVEGVAFGVGKEELFSERQGSGLLDMRAVRLGESQI